MPDYQLLIFDWDGTLMDSTARISTCFVDAARDIGVAPPDPAEVKQYIGLSLADAWSRLSPRYDASTIDALVVAYRQQWLYKNHTDMPLFDGVEDGLVRLQQHGYLLSVATGKSRAGLDRALQQCALDVCFAYTRCADESRAKPHPQMLIDVLDFTGLKPQDAVMIGDTTFDLTMAANAGMAAIAVGYGSHQISALQALTSMPVMSSFAQVVESLTGELDDTV